MGIVDEVQQMLDELKEDLRKDRHYRDLPDPSTIQFLEKRFELMDKAPRRLEVLEHVIKDKRMLLRESLSDTDKETLYNEIEALEWVRHVVKVTQFQKGIQCIR